MMKRYNLVFCLLMGSLILTAGEVSKITLVPMEKAPVIDGVINPEEWRQAVKILGFVTLGKIPLLEPRQGYTLIGFDREALYFAMATEMPPDNQLITNVKRHDENTCYDDSVEIWIDPNRRNKIKGQGDLRYYQLIINQLGTLLDVVFDPKKGVPDTGWDLKGHRFASRTNQKENVWEIELAVSWKSLGLDSVPVLPEEIGLMIARNWKRPWSQMPILPVTGFSDWSGYPVFVLQPEGIFVQESKLGPVFEGIFDYQISLTSTLSKQAEADIIVHVESSTMPALEKKERLTVPAGKTVTWQFSTPQGRFQKEGEHTFSVKVESGQQTVFSHSFVIRPVRRKIWEISAPLAESHNFFLAYYPSYNQLAVNIDLSQVQGKEKVSTAQIKLFDSSGKELQSAEMKIKAGQGELLMKLPDLADGTYTVKALVPELEQGKTFSRTFVRRHFPWENNCLGLSNKVYPPFQPVKLNGRTVDVVLRRYTMNEFGLWDSVISCGQEILGKPMTVEGLTDSGKLNWKKAKPKITCQSTKAEFTGMVESDPLIIKTFSVIEMDGCMKVEMTLSPGKKPAEIRWLAISVPLREEVVSLWHIMQSGSIRHNPTGAIAGGEGIIWESSQTGNGPMLGTFLPYIWLGGPEKGLAWFANNDRGWVTDDNKSVQVLIRKGGILTLKIYLINRPVTITAERKIVFGLQASPTKPMPENWRLAEDIPQHGGSNGYWGIIPHFAGKYPADRDYSFADELLIARRTGKVNREFLKEWVEKKIKRIITDNPEQVEDRTRHVYAGMNSISGRGRKPQLIYFEEHAQDVTTPEWEVFQDEWGLKQYTDRTWPQQQPGVGAQINCCRSYQDFALWHAREWMMRGLGMYCDNTYPRNWENVFLSDAYVRSDGQVQPSACIWELREYHRRMWCLQQDCQLLTEYPLLKSVHMTNGNILPVITWADISLDNEWSWKNGEEPFPPEVLQAEMIGRQAGNYPHALYPIIGTKNKPHGTKVPETVERAEWGFRFTHEILRSSNNLEKIVRDFGYGKDFCRIINYWEKQKLSADVPVIVVSNPGIKWIALWRPEDHRLLLTLVNWNRGTEKTEVEVFQGKKKINISWQNAEDGQPAGSGPWEFSTWEVKILKAKIPVPGKKIR